MKVVGIVGSPRKQGNTATLVSEILRGAQDAGAETGIYHLNAMNIRGCQGCRACKKQEGACVQSDDMQSLYAEIRGADAIVVGTPVYFCQMTGQTKIFMDRLYAFVNADFTNKLGDGKKTVMVYTQGQPKTGMFQTSFDMNNNMFAMVGLKVRETIVAAGNASPDDVLRNQDIMEKAYQAGKSLLP
jgi:multimeric flavodoxin WrbA